MVTLEMKRFAVRLAYAAALALLAASGAGWGRAAAATFDSALLQGIVPSALPALLGPIDEVGRKGWNCVPERAAAAKNPRAAELPAGDER
jgi:hypothetical protein